MQTAIPFGIIISFYIFLCISFLLNIKLTQRQLIFSLTILVLLVGILSYNYEPDINKDLYRYYVLLSQYKDYSWKEMQVNSIYNNTLITNIYFFIMSKGSNKSLVSAIPTVITFTLISVSSFYFSKRDVKFSSIAFFIIGIVSYSSLIGIISGIRQNLAWGFLMHAVYRDFFSENKKHTGMLLYIIPMLIHTSTIPFILLRLVMLFIKKISFLKYLVLVWPVFLILVNNYSYYLPVLFQDILFKLGVYADQGFEMTPKRITAAVGYLILLTIVLNIKRKYKQNYEKINSYTNESYDNYYLSVILFGISSIIVPTLFSRTFEFILYISLPSLNRAIINQKLLLKLLLLVLLVSYIMLFISQDVRTLNFL